MTVTTTENASWSHRPAELPSKEFSSARPVSRVEDRLDEAARRIMAGHTQTAPDPNARARMAAVLHRITGWAVFDGDERAYVSRLWAEDWDCDEDAVYDDQ